MNAKDGKGRATPLHRAAAAGHAAVISALLAAPGIQPNELDSVRAVLRSSRAVLVSLSLGAVICDHFFSFDRAA